mmetsp:Transcript_23541/g.63795  ORF Transcript_23541/g.63795 Transcript_23541/m.63795 type:complete len:286 (+) Transcript_23541:1918-2775(+)
MQPGAHVAWASAAAPPSGARLRAHAAPPARPSAERGAGHGAVRAASAPTAGGPARESGSPRRRRAAPAHIASRPRSPRRLSRRASLRPRHEQHPAAAIRVHSRCHGPAAADAPAVPWRARQEPELGQLVQVRQVRPTKAKSSLPNGWAHVRLQAPCSKPGRRHSRAEARVDSQRGSDDYGWREEARAKVERDCAVHAWADEPRCAQPLAPPPAILRGAPDQHPGRREPHDPCRSGGRGWEGHGPRGPATGHARSTDGRPRRDAGRGARWPAGVCAAARDRFFQPA